MRPISTISKPSKKEAMHSNNDDDLIQSLRDQLDQHVRRRLAELPPPDPVKNQDTVKDFLKTQKDQIQATNKVAEWLTERRRKLAKFPKSLIPGSKTMRDICTRLGDHLNKTAKSNSEMSSSVGSLLQTTSNSAQQIAHLEDRMNKLERESTGLIIGLSRELKTLRTQVHEMRRSQATLDDR